MQLHIQEKKGKNSVAYVFLENNNDVNILLYNLNFKIKHSKKKNKGAVDQEKTKLDTGQF